MNNTAENLMEPCEEAPVYVIGHMNPDTDSICSAIAYAYLKEKVNGKPYYPRRAGQLNLETKYVLERFGFQEPFYLADVRRQVKDMDVRKFKRVLSCLSLKKAWEWMADLDVVTLPIVDGEGKLEGLITERDIAKSYMEMNDPAMLSKAHTSYKNLTETLAGHLVVGDPANELEHGKVLVAAANPDIMEEYIEEGDIVITGNRYESQLCAIEMNASCVIVTGDVPISRTITIQAKQHGCAIIATPHDTFTAARLINQSIPIDFFMKKSDLITFCRNDFIDDVKDVMAKYRHRDFPVIDKDGKLLGMISRRKLLGAKKKSIILVDHNEKSQAVDNINEAEILEIIDHHRIGSLETISPVYFRNQPLGCTSTIIYQMFGEKNIEIPQHIAGLLLSAILSDTLMFRSPTCTQLDILAAEALAKIAKVDIETHAKNMFKAGSDFKNKTTEEIFYSDFKIFHTDEFDFGVAQISAMSREELDKVAEKLRPFLKEVLGEKRIDMVYVMLTDILEESSRVIFEGHDAGRILADAFEREENENGILLEGIISRKKQLIPTLMNAMAEKV